MEELITTGSIASAVAPGCLLQGVGDSLQQDGSICGEPEKKETEVVEVEPAEVVVGEEATPAKGKAKKKDPKVPKPPAEPRIKWSAREDVLLAEA